MDMLLTSITCKKLTKISTGILKNLIRILLLLSKVQSRDEDLESHEITGCLKQGLD